MNKFVVVYEVTDGYTYAFDVPMCIETASDYAELFCELNDVIDEYQKIYKFNWDSPQLKVLEKRLENFHGADLSNIVYNGSVFELFTLDDWFSKEVQK